MAPARFFMSRLLAVLWLLITASSALAQATGSFGVSASIVNGCSVSAITLAFGAYSGQATQPTVDQIGQITVTCANGNAYDVRLDNGVNNGAGGQRRMQRVGGGGFLNYELYKDSGRTQRWGNNNAQRLNGTGNGLPQQLPVYGRLPGAQVVAFGPYRDTITVTVQY